METISLLTSICKNLNYSIQTFTCIFAWIWNHEKLMDIQFSPFAPETSTVYCGPTSGIITHHKRWQKAQSSAKFGVGVFDLHTHRNRMIPVLDIAKANPRIPLPIMALLRLKTDMPNEVFPSNCSERMSRRQFDWQETHKWH